MICDYKIHVRLIVGHDSVADHRAQVQDQTGGAAVQGGRQGDRRHAGPPRTTLAGDKICQNESACLFLSGNFCRRLYSWDSASPFGSTWHCGSRALE